MAQGINKVILVGNLGNNPDTRATKTGSTVTNISIATSESWKDKQTGEKQDRTEWHRVVLHGRLAEIAAQYLQKGSKVYLEGSLRTNNWVDKDGNKRSTTEIVAAQMQMLDSRQSAPQAQPAQQPQAAPQIKPQPLPEAQDFKEDDIPF